MYFWRRLLLLSLLASPAPALAQEHGAAGGQTATATATGENGDAAALHRGFFADPRSYRLADSRILIVGLFQFPGSPTAQLRVLDVASGRVVNTRSTALDTLSAPDGESFILIEHGAQIEWRRRGGAAPVAGALNQNVVSEDVEFTNGDIRLAGRLTRPRAGRRPAVILAHGGGAVDRNFVYYSLLAGYFAERGFTVLTYDKRGVGRSRGGNAQQSSVVELGGDLSAAVRYLAARPDVDPDRIGIFGLSQGGWLGPMAAVETGQVAFLALPSAPPVDTWAQEMNEARSDLAAGNFTPEQTAAALDAMRLMLAAAESGAPTPKLVAAVAAAQGQPWLRTVELSDSAGNIAALRRLRYDPRPVIQRLRTPIFLAYGGADLITPFRDYVPAWRSALARAGARDVTIRVYPGAAHGLTNAVHGGDAAAAMVFAPGFLEAMSHWMEVRAGLQPADRRREPAGALDQADVALRASSLTGPYATPTGTVDVREMNGTLVVQDFERGRLTFLQPDPISRTAFMGIGVEAGAVRTPARVRFLRDGRLILSEAGRPDRTGRRLALREEEVSYRSGTLNQQGILVTPAGRGPFPAVIFLHGNGPATRHNFLSWARLFAANGIAAFSIDKRGYGGSDGDGASATLQNNADDAAAAVAYLAARPDIARGQIGLIGTSRGGWTAPMAAVQRPDDVAFLVASSGGPISVGAQERYARLRRAEAAGASGESLRQAAQVLDDYFAYLASDGREHVAEVRANFVRFQDQPWYRALRLPAADPTVGTLSPALRVFAEDLKLDAAALYQRLTVPVLFLYGTEDALFPTSFLAAAEGVARRLPGSQVRRFEGAGHNFNLPAQPGDTALTAPGYYETLIGWVRQRLLPAAATERASGQNALTRRGSGGSDR